MSLDYPYNRRIAKKLLEHDHLGYEGGSEHLAIGAKVESELKRLFHQALQKVEEKHVSGGSILPSGFPTVDIKKALKYVVHDNKYLAVVSRFGVGAAAIALTTAAGVPYMAPLVMGLSEVAMQDITGEGLHRRRKKAHKKVRRAKAGDIGEYKGGKMKKKKIGNDKRAKRAEKIREIMKKKGYSLPEASSYIKQHNLKY